MCWTVSLRLGRACCRPGAGRRCSLAQGYSCKGPGSGCRIGPNSAAGDASDAVPIRTSCFDAPWKMLRLIRRRIAPRRRSYSGGLRSRLRTIQGCGSRALAAMRRSIKSPIAPRAALLQRWPSLTTTENLRVWEPRPRGDAAIDQEPYRAEAALPLSQLIPLSQLNPLGQLLPPSQLIPQG